MSLPSYMTNAMKGTTLIYDAMGQFLKYIKTAANGHIAKCATDRQTFVGCNRASDFSFEPLNVQIEMFGVIYLKVKEKESHNSLQGIIEKPVDKSGTITAQ